MYGFFAVPVRSVSGSWSACAIGSGKQQGNKMARIIVIIYTNDECVTVSHVCLTLPI
jgi:hypothetical protein